jgi:hypothetical protein
MKNREKAKIAFAQSITQTLWLKGMITLQERDKMLRFSEEKLRKSNC